MLLPAYRILESVVPVNPFLLKTPVRDLRKLEKRKGMVVQEGSVEGSVLPHRTGTSQLRQAPYPPPPLLQLLPFSWYDTKKVEGANIYISPIQMPPSGCAMTNSH